MESTIFSVRMEKKLKNSFDKLCEDFGMSMSTAFTLFAKAVVREKKIPFTIISSKSKANAEDFTKAKENFYAIRSDYKKKGGKELTLDEINKVIYGK